MPSVDNWCNAGVTSQGRYLLWYSSHPITVQLALLPPQPLNTLGPYLASILPFDLAGMGGPTGSEATAGIALGIAVSTEPPHHDKVAIPEEEGHRKKWFFFQKFCKITLHKN